MTGEILRLRAARDYGVKLPKNAKVKVGYVWGDIKAPPGKHIVVAVLGAVPEDVELTEAFIEERMRLMGWVKA